MRSIKLEKIIPWILIDAKKKKEYLFERFFKTRKNEYVESKS